MCPSDRFRNAGFSDFLWEESRAQVHYTNVFLSITLQLTQEITVINFNILKIKPVIYDEMFSLL